MKYPIKKEKIVRIFDDFLKSKVLLGFIVFVFAVKLSASLVFINLPNNIFFADITKSTLVSMLNQTRQSLGLNTLAENTLLDQAAQLKAEDMVKNGYFSHNSPTGTTPWHWFSQSGYNYKYAGENLAIGFYDSTDVYKAWLDSSSHKQNMLNSAYTEVGTAIIPGFGDNNAIIVVQLFGTQKPAVKAKTATPKPVVTTPVVAKTETVEVVNEPETKTETKPETVVENIQGEKVLSSSISIEADKNNTVNDFYSRFLNFAIYSYDTLLEYVIYGLALIIMAMFVYIISFNFNAQVNNGLALRSLVLILILISSALINKDLIVSIIPHQIVI
jgi:hypothetical protein